MKAKNNVPFISLLVVNYNGEDILKLCFPSLKKLNYPKDKYEIIVVDNGSTDGSVQFLKKRYPDVKIVQNKKNLGYVGSNLGLKYCKGKYIYVLNNDLILQKDCLHHLVKELQKDKDIGMVAHDGINYYNKKLISGGTWASRTLYCGHHPIEDRKEVKEIPYMGSGIIRKSVIEAYGYIFDPDYFIYAEDLDLGLRIRLLGMKTVLVKKARCYHLHSSTMKRVSNPSRNTFLLERNLLTTYLKIFSLRTILYLFPFVLVARILIMIKDVLRLNFKNAFARLKSILWVLYHFRAILIKRAHTQKLRKVRDSYILRIFSEKYVLKRPYLV